MSQRRLGTKVNPEKLSNHGEKNLFNAVRLRSLRMLTRPRIYIYIYFFFIYYPSECLFIPVIFEDFLFRPWIPFLHTKRRSASITDEDQKTGGPNIKDKIQGKKNLFCVCITILLSSQPKFVSFRNTSGWRFAVRRSTLE